MLNQEKVREDALVKWAEICSHYPNRFVLVEAIKAISKNRQRTLEEMTVVEEFENPLLAWDGYKQHHKENPNREFYVFHTSKHEIEVIEENFTGFRGM